MHIAILYSAPTGQTEKHEYEVTDADTVNSAHKIQVALQSKGADASLHAIHTHKLGDIESIHADCVVNLIEWDGPLLSTSFAALLEIEKLHVPTTGATKENYMMMTDKVQMKHAYEKFHIPTARWQIFETGHEAVRSDFVYPVIIKLTQTHCSVGLSHASIVHTAPEVTHAVTALKREFKEAVLVEEFIDGRELQITLLERPYGLTVLPPAEVIFKKKGQQAFLTYESRWEEKAADYKDSNMEVAKLTMEQMQLISTTSLRTFKTLGFRDYARFDARLRNENGTDVLYFLETNANPGLDDTTNYGIPISFKAIGMTFADFIWEIIANTMKRGVA